MVGMVLGNRIDINPIMEGGTGIRSLVDRLKHRIPRSQLGVPLVGTATIEEGVEVPPQEVVTPRPSNRVIRNDNYCALSVQTKVLYNFAPFV